MIPVMSLGRFQQPRSVTVIDHMEKEQLFRIQYLWIQQSILNVYNFIVMAVTKTFVRLIITTLRLLLHPNAEASACEIWVKPPTRASNFKFTVLLSLVWTDSDQCCNTWLATPSTDRNKYHWTSMCTCFGNQSAWQLLYKLYRYQQ